jgi:hypothetical protein
MGTLGVGVMAMVMAMVGAMVEAGESLNYKIAGYLQK